MKLRQMNLEELTVGEAVRIEEYLGMSLEEYQKELNRYQSIDENPPEIEGNPPLRLLIPAIWLSGRADNPSFSITDAENVRFSELETDDDAPVAEAVAANGKGAGKGKKGKASKASTAG
jgi:hypothetical protein